MSRRTTCSSCVNFDADDKGRPVNGEGHITGLCQLTRPEVKESIQEDNLIDKRTCPNCQHEVGNHVAKDDDAMTWPPQPIGTQRQAQGTQTYRYREVAVSYDAAFSDAYKLVKQNSSLRALLVALALQPCEGSPSDVLVSNSTLFNDDGGVTKVTFLFPRKGHTVLFQNSIRALSHAVGRGVCNIQVRSTDVGADLAKSLLTLDYDTHYTPREGSPEKPPLTTDVISLAALKGIQGPGLPAIAQVTRSESGSEVTEESLDQSSPIAMYQFVDTLDREEIPREVRRYYKCHLKAKRNDGGTGADNIVAGTWSFHQLLDGLNTVDNLPALDVHGHAPARNIALPGTDNRSLFWLVFIYVNPDADLCKFPWRRDRVFYKDLNGIAVPIAVTNPNAMLANVEEKKEENRAKFETNMALAAQFTKWDNAAAAICEDLAGRQSSASAEGKEIPGTPEAGK